MAKIKLYIEYYYYLQNKDKNEPILWYLFSADFSLPTTYSLMDYLANLVYTKRKQPADINFDTKQRLVAESLAIGCLTKEEYNLILKNYHPSNSEKIDRGYYAILGAMNELEKTKEIKTRVIYQVFI